MPGIADLPQIPAVYRFFCRKSPFWVTPKNEKPYRAYLLCLKEVDGQVLALEAIETLPSWDEMTHWLEKVIKKRHKHLPNPKRPQAISVPDLSTYQGLRFTLRPWGVELLHEPDDQDIDELYDALNEGQTPLSAVQILGQDVAAQLYQKTESMLNSKPWSHPNSDALMILIQSQPKHAYGVILMGQGGEEFGILLMDSVQDAERIALGVSVEPLIGLTWSPASAFHHRDLGLLDEIFPQLEFERCPHIWLGEDAAESHWRAAEWLLDHLDTFLNNEGKPLTQGGFHLEALTPEESPWEDFDVFCEPWKKKGKLSNRAFELLDYLHNFLLDLKYEDGLTEATINNYIKGCSDIANWLLKGKTNRAFDPQIFLVEPTFREQFLQEKGASNKRWQQLLRTWKRLKKSYETMLQQLSDDPTDSLGLEALAGAHLMRLAKKTGWQTLLKEAREEFAESLRQARKMSPDLPKGLMQSLPQVVQRLSQALAEVCQSPKEFKLAKEAIESTLSEVEQAISGLS